MNRVRFHLGLELDDIQCERVIQSALLILDEIGIECTSEIVRNVLGSLSGVRCSGNRVFFRESDVRRHIQEARLQTIPFREDEGKLRQESCWTCLNFADVPGNKIRTATETDLAAAVRLYESMGISGTVPPVILSQVPLGMQDLYSTLVCLENSRTFGGPVHLPTEENLVLFREMFAIAGRSSLPVLLIPVVSPLRFNAETAEFFIRHCKDPDLRFFLVSGMPCAGSTAPVSLFQACALSLAEALATSLFGRACTGNVFLPGFSVDPFDFKYGNHILGSPQSVLLNSAARRIMTNITGQIPRDGFLLSMARWPDAHAVFDHAQSALLQSLHGVRRFYGSGQLSQDEVFCPEMVIIDRDILSGVEWLLQGMEWDENPQACLETIRHGVRTGSFLEHETTLEGFRRFVVETRLFSGMSMRQWESAGSRNLLSEAADCVSDLVSKNDYRISEMQSKALRMLLGIPEQRP